MKPSEESTCRLLLADANVLIDLASVEDGLGLIGDLVRFGIAEVYLPRTVYDEVASMVTEGDVLRLGMTILPVTEKSMRTALDYSDKKLSVPDRTLLAVALERQYGVWSNDRRLRENCERNGVPVFWEFQILKELVVRGFVEKARLIGIARAVEEKNLFLKMKGLSQRLEAEL